MTSLIILHIPHASLEIPSKERYQIQLNDQDLEKELIFMTDSYTDELYDYSFAKRVEFPVSRLVLDPERFANDDQEPMAARGMGVIYTITSHLKALREKPLISERERLLDTYYYPHHDKLTQETADTLNKHGKCLIIDCHSFPSKALPYELKEGIEHERPEICIGSDAFHTPPEVTKILEGFFKNAGYSFDINTPFAGSLTPMKYYGHNPSVMSVMFEIRRDLYMDEVTGKKLKSFYKIKKDITEAISLLDQFIKEN